MNRACPALLMVLAVGCRPESLDIGTSGGASDARTGTSLPNACDLQLIQPAGGTHPGAGAAASAIADLDGDGKLDVVMSGVGGVGVAFGNGDGTFQPFDDYAFDGCGACSSLAIGDVNGDGLPDLFADGDESGVLLGKDIPADDDGGVPRLTFFQPVARVTSQVFHSAHLADMNGDGKQDIVGAESNQVLVFLGNGDGSFDSTPLQAGSGSNLSALCIGDFNADGHLDVAVADVAAGAVYTLLGTGDGNLVYASGNLTSASPMSVAVGDMNGDGNVDLVVADEGAGVGILYGNGDGTFGHWQVQGEPGGPAAIADMNGDGVPDVVLVQQAQTDVVVYANDGRGNLSAIARQTTLAGPNSVSIGDLNGDGHPDLAISNSSAKGDTILLSTCDTGD